MTQLTFPWDLVNDTPEDVTHVMQNLQAIAAIINGNLGADNLADNAVGETELAPDSVGTLELIDLAVTAAKIALLAVGTPQLANLAVTTAKIALLAVGTGQLADNAVTQAKMADNSVGAAEIIADAVGSSELAANAVGASELANGTISLAHFLGGAERAGSYNIAASAAGDVKINPVTFTAGAAPVGSACILIGLSALGNDTVLQRPAVTGIVTVADTINFLTRHFGAAAAQPGTATYIVIRP